MGAPNNQHEVAIATRRYRTAKAIPATLLDHVTVCIEEGLYQEALSLLTSCLTAGNGTSRPALVPPSRVLAVTATLTVHPSMTTRTSSKDKHAAAEEAVRYLTHLESLVGAKNARFRFAFHFQRSEDLRANRARSRRALDSDEQEVESFRCVYAGQQSLWSQAEDFWHMVGWALNCSVAHKQRWHRWKFLLDVLLDALWENDLLEANTQQYGDELEEDAFDDTMLAQCLETVGAGRNNKRRIMRAILADGSSKSVAEFGQIWENETAGPKVVQPQKKRRKLDIEHGDYGDYDMNSDDEMDVKPHQPSTQQSTMDDDVSTPETVAGLGDLDAIRIRQRCLALLAQLCVARPEAFLSIEDLFDLYVEFLRTLPLRLFQDLVMGLGAYLGEDSQSSLYQMLLRPSIDATAPVYNKNELTQDDFEAHFAPYAANSSSLSENVKVSLIVEDSLRLLWKAGMLSYTEELRRTVTRGIAARKEKVNADGRRKTDDGTYEEECLRLSSSRLVMLLDIIQHAQ
ncbi:hypothetical protein AMS68_001301 [Peltaster fructicola]|uniref:Uncharacterized protein n=1 Tax=Peltaster fructicola TaxID=286661 RepID=A0A6H0XM33_9PEZI|nr:hypothetical protein AMS68_001301 [Peltaster fructicola]